MTVAGHGIFTGIIRGEGEVEVAFVKFDQVFQKACPGFDILQLFDAVIVSNQVEYYVGGTYRSPINERLDNQRNTGNEREYLAGF